MRDVSSVGLEHRLDRAGVTGSNPVHPTKSCLFRWLFYFWPTMLYSIFGLTDIPSDGPTGSGGNNDKPSNPSAVSALFTRQGDKETGGPGEVKETGDGNPAKTETSSVN